MDADTDDLAKDAAGKVYWDAQWDSLPPIITYEGPGYEQHPVLYPYLSSQRGEAIEIGCVPGNWMIYLNKEYGYRVSGIDYSKHMDYVRENLRYNGIDDGELFNADLFQFDPEKKYDLVFSSGFVEHFDDYVAVVRKHAELACSGALVVIMTPNLTHIHKILCKLFCPDLLKVHRFPLMDRKILSDTLESVGLEVLHCDFQKTFRPLYHLPTPLNFAMSVLSKILRMTHLDNIGNRFGSPYLISVSRKK